MNVQETIFTQFLYLHINKCNSKREFFQLNRYRYVKKENINNLIELGKRQECQRI